MAKQDNTLYWLLGGAAALYLITRNPAATGAAVGAAKNDSRKFTGIMATEDGPIKAIIEYNSFYKKWQLYIDGSLMDEAPGYMEMIQEAKRAGFKNIVNHKGQNI